MYVWNGSVSYDDDDEPFLEKMEDKDDVSGVVVLRLHENEFMDLLTRLSKVDPDWANKHIVSEFYNSNIGECCGIEYHSRWKKERCVNCGKEVSLT